MGVYIYIGVYSYDAWQILTTWSASNGQYAPIIRWLMTVSILNIHGDGINTRSAGRISQPVSSYAILCLWIIDQDERRGLCFEPPGVCWGFERVPCSQGERPCLNNVAEANVLDSNVQFINNIQIVTWSSIYYHWFLVFICFSPPARWGLLDFMSVVSSSFRFSSSSSSSFSSSSSSFSSSSLSSRRPRPTAIRDPRRSLPDLNQDHPRPVFPAGPQPRPSTPSVPCRTSTASIHAKCSLPDLNREYPRQVFPAGPHVGRYGTKNVQKKVRKNVRKNVKRYARRYAK